MHKGNPKGQQEFDMWHERTSSLDPILTQPVWGRGKGEKREEKKERVLEKERVYLLSRFPDDRSMESRRDKRQS